jgi:uncharacterized sulfatase
MTSRTTLAVCAATLAIVCAVAASSAQEPPPNVVLIIGDDHGWPYSGFMGHPFVQTPNLDALAAGGTLFRNAHVTASVCMPSLRALLAGIHSNQWDAERDAIGAVVGAFPRREEVTHYRTLPRELARHGYVSWEGGKMWEGTYWQAGFSAGLATSIGGFFSSVGDHFGRTGWQDATALDPLRAFLDEAGTRPFFAWVAPMLPHPPVYDAPAEFRAPYEQLGLSDREVAYYSAVTWLDAIVGEVLAELGARGLRDDTLVLYISDNGWGVDQVYAGLGKGKGTLYEMGFRTPLIVNWPGRVPAGVVREDLVSSLDVLPTILEYAGADPLPDRAGLSLVGAITNGTPVGRQRIVGEYFGTAANQGHFVRTPSWRYIAFSHGREELYDIAADPYEEVDVAGAHPEILEGFRNDVLAWQQSIAEPAPLLDAAGRLVDESDGPIAGAELQLRGSTESGRALRLRVLTSPSGEFRFQSVPRGSYVLTAARRAGDLSFGPFLDRIAMPLPVGTLGSYFPLRGRQERTLPEANSSILRGVLRSDTGVPLAGATITLRGKAAKTVLVTVRSGSDGRYRAENLPPGAYRVTAAAGPGFRHPPLRVTIGEGVDQVADLVAIAR